MTLESSTGATPLVSIGIPVYNEESYICGTIESLLEQTHANIEIIISDNCSTDNTGELCRQYADRYERVSYHLMEQNEGAAANFNKVLQLASGEYFLWASGHDLWHSEFIERCVNVLKRHSKAVLAFGDSTWIDENGDKLDREYGWSDTRGLHVIARYVTVLWGHMNPVLGLIRRDQLEDNITLSMVGADLVILTRLAIAGDFVFAEGARWQRRDQRLEQSYTEKLERYKSKSFGLSGKSILGAFPLLQLPIELIKVVLKSRLGFAEKSLLFLLVLFMFPFRYLVGKFFMKMGSGST